MDDEKLIELVREHPVMYDMSHKKYLDSKYKYNIWNNIAKELNEKTGEACKKRWSNIRDQFKRNLNKRKPKSGQGAVNIKKYKYDENLQFLMPHVEERETLSNIESENKENQIKDTENAHTAADVQPSNELQPSAEPPLSTDAHTRSVLPLPNTVPATQFIKSQNQHRRKIPQSSQVNTSASQTLMKYIIENNNKPTDPHPIDAFLCGIAPTLKKLSPYHQHIAKGRIFAVVQDLEWEQLSSEPGSRTTLSAGSSISGHVPPSTSTPAPSATSISPIPSTSPLPSESTIPTLAPSTTADNLDLTNYFSQYTEHVN